YSCLDLHPILVDSLILFTASALPPSFSPSLHDALPICLGSVELFPHRLQRPAHGQIHEVGEVTGDIGTIADGQHIAQGDRADIRSEEHTSELQSRFDLVCRLLLEKKNEDKLWFDLTIW